MRRIDTLRVPIECFSSDLRSSPPHSLSFHGATQGVTDAIVSVQAPVMQLVADLDRLDPIQIAGFGLHSSK